MSVLDTIGGSGWRSTARDRWEEVTAPCEERGCTLARRLWRRLRWWNTPIRFHDRRCCAPQCFEKMVRQRFGQPLTMASPVDTVRHRIPLGLLMLSRGQLTNQQLQSALDAQQSSGNRRLGEWLEKLGFATEQQVTAALGLQWACPVLVHGERRDAGCAGILPYRLLETFRMVPLLFVEATRTFYLAFSDGIDYPVLYALEQMLNCRTEACLVSRTTMDAALEEIGSQPRPGDLLFEGWRDAAEMARITCSYVVSLGVEQVRSVRCGPFLWVRLQAGRDVAHLLFRNPAASQDPRASSTGPDRQHGVEAADWARR